MATTQTLRHIGGMNILAISGGRKRFDGETVVLPVSSGYTVEVEYVQARDLYDVRRVFTRSGVRRVKGEVQGVYADQVGEAAYQASCFRNVEFGR